MPVSRTTRRPPNVPSRSAAGTPPQLAGTGLRVGVLAAVLAVHTAALALLLAIPRTTPSTITSPPIMVSLMGPPRQNTQGAVTPAPLPSPVTATTPPAKAASKSSPAPTRPTRRPPDPRPDTAPSTTAPVSPTAVLSAPPAPPATPSEPTAGAPQSLADSTPSPSASPPSGNTPPRFDAAYLNNHTPYPPLARRLRESGTVRLRVLVSAEGLAEQVELLSSSGSPRLDAGAREAVQHWRFIPARQGDRPVASTVVVPIIYRLEDS